MIRHTHTHTHTHTHIYTHSSLTTHTLTHIHTPHKYTHLSYTHSKHEHCALTLHALLTQVRLEVHYATFSLLQCISFFLSLSLSLPISQSLSNSLLPSASLCMHSALPSSPCPQAERMAEEPAELAC